jgi:hypothetical protein
VRKIRQSDFVSNPPNNLCLLYYSSIYMFNLDIMHLNNQLPTKRVGCFLNPQKKTLELRNSAFFLFHFSCPEKSGGGKYHCIEERGRKNANFVISFMYLI